MKPSSPSSQKLRACDFEDSLEFARACDARDPLRTFRRRFHIPLCTDGTPVVYLAGNSLGLQPKTTRRLLLEELDDWAEHGVEGHVNSRRAWVRYHEFFREGAAALVGAKHSEVVAMNTLTVNLHLLMVSFYRPEGKRTKILIERGAFPSDTYAAHSHIRSRGLDPATNLVFISPRAGERCLRMEDIESIIAQHADQIALVMLPGVQYLTGQVLDIARITAAAHRAGARCGWDLAHAVGNVPLALHDANVDFAAWCSYKYLNGGPGAVAGAFIHERHGSDHHLPRYLGWWSNDPANRFEMRELFTPTEGADGWAVSNPPILSLTPLLASFELFKKAGLERVFAKSRLLSGYLQWLLRQRADQAIARGVEALTLPRVVTPANTDERASQVSIVVGNKQDPALLKAALSAKGIVVDCRQPDIVRAAPVPLYNNMEDVWRFVDALPWS